MDVKTLERCSNETVDREMSNIVDTVEDRIQNAILTAIDNIVAPKIELAFRSINASSERDATSVSANSERREHVGIITSFENASGNNNTLGVSNVNDEARHNIPDEVGELSVPEAHFDRQAHTRHIDRRQNLNHQVLGDYSGCFYHLQRLQKDEQVNWPKIEEFNWCVHTNNWQVVGKASWWPLL